MTIKSNNSYKVVLLGEGRVGKTSILQRYINDSYTDSRPSTLHASYFEKHVIIDDDDDKYAVRYNHSYEPENQTAQLCIWDTAGQERYHSLGPIYYRDARGAILVYDITDRPSFDRVQNWSKELRKMVGDNKKIRLMIVGNKLDLEKQRAVDIKEANDFAVKIGAGFTEVSAKTGSGIDDVFVELTRNMMMLLTPSSRQKLTFVTTPEMISCSKTSNQIVNNRISLFKDTELETKKCC